MGEPLRSVGYQDDLGIYVDRSRGRAARIRWFCGDGCLVFVPEAHSFLVYAAVAAFSARGESAAPCYSAWFLFLVSLLQFRGAGDAAGMAKVPVDS